MLPGTSSTAGSNYGNNPVINRNDDYLGRSSFETEHRFVINLSYDVEFFSGYNTNFSTFFERKSGKPINYVLGVTQFSSTVKADNPYAGIKPRYYK